jgi:hypothetical protein
MDRQRLNPRRWSGLYLVPADWAGLAGFFGGSLAKAMPQLLAIDACSEASQWKRRLIATLGVLAITLLGAVGSAAIFSATRASYEPGLPFFVGMLCLIPCWFIYRSVFRR